MTALRIYTRWPVEGYAAPVRSHSGGLERLSLLTRMNRESLAAEWSRVDLSWDRQKKSDKLADVTIELGYCGAICFPRALLPRLFPPPASGLEFLSAQIEDEDWVLLNCLRVTDAIDEASSDLVTTVTEGGSPWISDVRWINIVDPRALQWDVFCIPNSPAQDASRRLLVSELFVERYRRLGLRGLDFKHIGYVVPDASQAVPKPPEPLAPPPKPSRRKDPKLTSAPLPVTEQIELTQAGAEWRQRLQLASDASAEAVLQRLTQELQAQRPTFWTVTAEERIDATLGLSAIYGELLCSQCGWSWVELRQSRSKRWIAVTSADGRHALALLPYIQQQMQSEAPTVTLLFNMIRAGDLPRAEAGQPVLVA